MAAKTVIGPQNVGIVGRGTGGTANPGTPNVNIYTGQPITPAAPAPAAAPAAAAAAAPAAPPNGVAGVHDAAWWATILGMDPGYTAATAAADEAIKNLNEQFDGVGNPFSTISKLGLSLRQGLRGNANQHAARGTLFSGGTAQGASNLNRDNQQARFDAQSNLNAAVAAQNAAKGNAAGQAASNIMAHPEWYGVGGAPDPTPAPAPAPAPGAPAPAAPTPVIVGPKTGTGVGTGTPIPQGPYIRKGPER